MGLEREIKHYLSHLEVICARIMRVMKPTASLWIHMADKGSYTHEMMQGIPERFFVDMITQWGWYAPDKPLWHRTEKSVRKNDRHLKRNWEPVYRFVKDPDLYYFNEKASNGYQSVFSYPMDYNKEHSHNIESGFPEELVEGAIRTCLTPGNSSQTILDPFAGTGTTGLVAKRNHKSFIMMDISERRCQAMAGRLMS